MEDIPISDGSLNQDEIDALLSGVDSSGLNGHIASYHKIEPLVALDNTENNKKILSEISTRIKRIEHNQIVLNNKLKKILEQIDGQLLFD